MGNWNVARGSWFGKRNRHRDDGHYFQDLGLELKTKSEKGRLYAESEKMGIVGCGIAVDGVFWSIFVIGVCQRI